MAQDVAVYVVDDDESTHHLMRLLLKTVGLEVAAYASASEFIEKFDPHRPGCVILDLWMPELNGFETMIRLRQRAKSVPVIFLTAHGDLSAVVRAMKLGAVDFFEKPANNGLLLESIQHWVQQDIKVRQTLHRRQVTLDRLATLTRRQRQVLDCVLNGMTNKEMARHLGVSPKVIETHRKQLMQKMEASNVVKLAVQVGGCLELAELAEASHVVLYRFEHAKSVNAN